MKNKKYLNSKNGSVLQANETKQKRLEKIVSQAFKSFKSTQLSEEQYRKLYDEAFEKASTLLKSDVKLAEEIKKLPKLSGFRSDKYKVKGKETEIKTKTKILEVEYGLNVHQGWEIQQIDNDLCEETIEKAKKNAELPTRRLALKILRKKRADKNRDEKMKKKREAFTAIHYPEALKLGGDKYDVIYANPPYKGEMPCKDACSIEDIKKLQIPATDNAVLFLWTSRSEFFSSLDIASAWGFTPLQDMGILVFGKAKKTNFCFNNQHKILLVAIKSEQTPKPQLTRPSVHHEISKNTCIIQKYYHEIIERMYPKGRYLDVFASKPFNSKWDTLSQNFEKEQKNETD